MDEDDFYRKYGDRLMDRDFRKKLLRRIWKDAAKFPRLKAALIRAGVPPQDAPRERLLPHATAKAKTQADPLTAELRRYTHPISFIQRHN